MVACKSNRGPLTYANQINPGKSYIPLPPPSSSSLSQPTNALSENTVIPHGNRVDRARMCICPKRMDW